MAAKRPVYVSPTKAAEMMGCCYRTAIKYADRGLLGDVRRPLGKGSAKRVKISKEGIVKFMQQVATPCPR
jgi:hypothetical protein